MENSSSPFSGLFDMMPIRPTLAGGLSLSQQALSGLGSKSLGVFGGRTLSKNAVASWESDS